MYQALLTRRYLTSRIMPLLAALAVMLNTAMVLIVWSVMGGFLTMLLASGRSLMGDVIITWPVVGIPHYESLIDRVEEDPLAEAATPTVEAPGLLGLPDGSVRMVNAVGVDGSGYDEVTGYHEALWWKPIDEPLPRDAQGEDPRLDLSPKYERHGLTLTEPDPETGEPTPAIVPGVWVSGYNERDPRGWTVPTFRFLPDAQATLSVLPLSQQGVAIDVQARRLPVANEFQTGLYEVDANTVLVRLDALQEMLGMDAAERIEEGFDFGQVVTGPDGEPQFAQPQVTGRAPARATSVLIRGAEGVEPMRLRDRAETIYSEFAQERGDEVPDPEFMQIYTWEQRPGVRGFISAVRHEIALTVALFAFISLTAVFLVFAIFWAMVSEKTRDVGILRSMGASRAGVAWVFIRYGVVIGAIGSALGGAVAWLIVTNINPIHEWLSSTLNVTIWDPKTYYFPKIPNEIDPAAAAIVLAGGVLFSVLGSLAPAIKAANMDPVEALRFE